MSNRTAVILGMVLLMAVMAFGIARRAPAPFRPQVDSVSYRLVDLSDTRALLSNIRTPVYPAFLEVADMLGVPDPWRPLVQGVFFAVMVLVFWFGCVTSGLPVPQSLAASLPLACSTAFLRYMDREIPETLAAGLGFATLGLILGRTSFKRWYVRETLLGLLLAIAVLTKPQYLTLVPVSLGTLFLLWRAGHFQPIRSRRRELLAAVGLTCAPLLAYACLRLALLGHFGIASFAGTNLAGLALNPMMFDEAVVETLPAGELRDAGNAVLPRRAYLLEASRSATPPATPEWFPCPADTIDVVALRERPFFDAWSHAYDAAQYSVARPAVAQWLGHGIFPLDGQPNIETDRLLVKLSAHALMERPLPYLRWIGTACFRTLERGLWQERWSVRLISALAGVALVAACGFGAANIGRNPGLGPLQRWCAVSGLLLGSVCLSGRLIGIAGEIWGWIPGFLAPVLFPASVILAGLILACARALRGTASGRMGPTEFLVICCSLWAAATTFLFCSIETPLDRYLMTVRPLVAAACLAVLVWGGTHVTRRVRPAWADIVRSRPRGGPGDGDGSLRDDSA